MRPDAAGGSGSRRAAGVLLCLGGLAAASASPGSAQESPAERIAEEFHRGFQSMAWEGLAQRMHPEALAYVRLALDIVVDADSSGWALRHLAGGVPDREAYRALGDAEVFRLAMTGVQAEVPGLLSSLVSRRSQVLGSVAEGPDTAHVVYRVVGLVQGAEPRVRTLTVVRTAEGWRVRFAEEVDVLHTALRGVPSGLPIPRRPPERPRPAEGPGRPD